MNIQQTKTNVSRSVQFQEFEDRSAIEIIRWASKSFGQTAALASSFGLEDMVLIDMISKTDPRIAVFTLDTGRLPEETYKLMDETRRKYDINIQSYFPDAKKVEEMVRKYGQNLFYDSIEKRKMCCGVRKVEPLNRALTDCRAWVTGLRREQTATRSNISKISLDSDHEGIVKISPLADWNSVQVWSYIRENNVPYNELHDRGYPSIGCEPCTRAVKDGDDPRSGRWWWEIEGTRECGLHLRH